MSHDALIGIGLYTAVEAQRLVHVSSSKIVRWLRGHTIQGKAYEPLWRPQVQLGDGSVCLGFRDLMEIRAVDQFISAGVSAQAVRKALIEARKHFGEVRPLSTTQFRTDGRTIFLEVAEREGDSQLFDLVKKQYAFKEIVDRSLKNIEFEGGVPKRWWVNSERGRVVVDPALSFGQPVEADTSIPTVVLANAVRAEGSIAKAALAWCVTKKQIERAFNFEQRMQSKAA